MARKGLLDSVMGSKPSSEQKQTRSSYVQTGASKSMKMSLDDMAENAKRLTDGETVVKIDPSLIDASFMRDRLHGDDQAFEELKSMIAEHGQETPALLKPHPTDAGRYMVVFGHRRVRVARALGIEVRAVIRELEDIAHVIAQGQENTAREDLSFIEKALYAKSILDEGYDKNVAMAALTIDATLLSRMLSVSQKISLEFIEAIGAAKTVGRDRWEELKRLIILPANKKKALALLETEAFRSAQSDVRFDQLLNLLNAKGTSLKKAKQPTSKTQKWEAGEGRIKASLSRSTKAYTISLKSSDAVDFGEYLSENLEAFYRAFEEQNKGNL